MYTRWVNGELVFFNPQVYLLTQQEEKNWMPLLFFYSIPDSNDDQAHDEN